VFPLTRAFAVVCIVTNDLSRVMFCALLLRAEMSQIQHMHSLTFSAIASLLLWAPPVLTGQPPRSAVSAFDSCVRAIEVRLDYQHRSPDSFLARAEPNIEQLTPASMDLPGALLHHWRGTAFAPEAKAADFEHLLRDVASYPRHFSPQVLRARVLAREGDHMQTKLRVRHKNIITVVMDATYDVTFGQLDAQHRYSTSKSLRISEFDAGEGHGFLWRLNTYWSYEERDGGLYLQIEAVSLTRSIPRGLGWLIQPWVERIPRESLVFTLRCALAALRNSER
jgi:ribosome-associated toxin RatA of RatAB toxin-antitoxin module